MKLYKCYRSIYSLKTERCEVWANSELDAAEKATKRAESDDVEIDYPSYDERHWECVEQMDKKEFVFECKFELDSMYYVFKFLSPTIDLSEYSQASFSTYESFDKWLKYYEKYFPEHFVRSILRFLDKIEWKSKLDKQTGEQP